MQQRIFTVFNFSLNDGGILFLGGSESIGEATDRFQPLSTRHNLYRNRRIGVPMPPMRSVLPAPRIVRGRTSVSPAPLAGETPSLEQLHQTIVREFAPACLVVDERDDIVQVVGRGGDYLKNPAGPITRNLFKLTGHNLAHALRSLLLHARQEEGSRAEKEVRFADGDARRRVRIEVRPVPDARGQPSGLRIVALQELKPEERKPGRAARPDLAAEQRLEELERDLTLTRESLQATVHELETSNEEIQAANEELLAANEELQSTNEELQSVNEELHTVNIENQNRIEELNRLTNDINNLLATASVGVLLVDPQLRVRRASRSALLLLGLTEGDMGVPIETVARLLKEPGLSALAERVMQTEQLEEIEVERPGLGRWILVRCLPFRNEFGRGQGAVVTLIDITERHLAEARLRVQIAFTQGVLDAMAANVALLDRTGKIIHVNKNWRDFATANGATDTSSLDVGANYFDVCARSIGKDSDEARGCLEGLQKVAHGKLSQFVLDYPCHSPTDERWFRLHAVPLAGAEPGLAVAHFDITPIKKAEQLLAART